MRMAMKWGIRDYDDKVRCHHCNKVITGTPKWIEVIDGGATVISSDEIPDVTDSGYMGFYEIGVGCAKKYFKGFARDH